MTEDDLSFASPADDLIDVALDVVGVEVGMADDCNDQEAHLACARVVLGARTPVSL